jgi:hypothetical protein
VGSSARLRAGKSLDAVKVFLFSFPLVQPNYSTMVNYKILSSIHFA